MERDPQINRCAEFGYEFAKDILIKINEGLLVSGIHTIDDWLNTLEDKDVYDLQRRLLIGRIDYESQRDESVELVDWILTTQLLAELEIDDELTIEETCDFTGMLFNVVTFDAARRKGFIKVKGRYSLINFVDIEITEAGKKHYKFEKENV